MGITKFTFNLTPTAEKKSLLSKQRYFFPHYTKNIISLKQAQSNHTQAFVYLCVYASQEPAKISILNSINSALCKNLTVVMIFMISKLKQIFTTESKIHMGLTFIFF